jgi:hypothetical protein
VARLNQLGNDSLGAALGYANLAREVPHSNIGVSCDADEDLSMAGQEAQPVRIRVCSGGRGFVAGYVATPLTMKLSCGNRSPYRTAASGARSVTLSRIAVLSIYSRTSMTRSALPIPFGIEPQRAKKVKEFRN